MTRRMKDEVRLASLATLSISFRLTGGVLLDGLLDGGGLVFKVVEGTFLLAGKEGEGTVVGLEAGDRVFQRFEIHLGHRPVEEEVGGCGDHVAFEQRQHFADEGQNSPGNADDAFEFGGFGLGALECSGDPFWGGGRFRFRGLSGPDDRGGLSGWSMPHQCLWTVVVGVPDLWLEGENVPGVSNSEATSVIRREGRLGSVGSGPMGSITKHRPHHYRGRCGKAQF